MTIKVSYTSASPVYINIGYGTVDGGAVWGDITGTLSNQADLQAALNAKVPYSGATGNVNLGEYELKAGQLTFDTSPTGTATVATMRWNDTTGLTETTLKGGSVVLKNGVDLVARVVNKVSPNTTLTKAAYQAVRVSGAQGQRLAIELAQANNDNNSADTIGLVTETIATNQEGFIMTVGQLEGINTTGSLQGETWVDGDVLYLSPTTAGSLTNVKPVAPQHLVIIGYVEYAHANNGKIYVKVMNGWELGELHDVNTTGATNGSVLKYNGSIWVPSSDIDTGITSLNGLTALSQSFATGTSGTDFNISSATSTHTFNLPSASATNRGLLTSADWTTFNNKQNALTNPITGTGTTNYLPKFTGATTLGNSNIFENGGSVGIGTTTLTGKSLSISKNVTGSINAFVVYNDGQIQSDVTSSANYFQTSVTTAASTTIAQIRHFLATQSTFGAGTSVTNQIGFYANSSMIGATNNYGFYGDLASATGVWNLYLTGTAANFINGNLQLGSTTAFASGEKFQLSGNARILTTSTGGLILEATSGTETPNLIFLSTTNRYNIDNSSGTLRFFRENTDGTSGAVRMSLTDDGNLGLGVTPSAWQSGQAAVQGSGWAITQTGVNNTYYIQNATYNGTNWLYRNSFAASFYVQQAGSHQFWYAPSGTAGNVITTWNQGMTLFATGNFTVGNNVDAGFKLDVNGTMRVSGNTTLGGTLTMSSGLIMFLGTSRIFDIGGSLVFGTTANPMIFQGNDGGARQFFFNNTVLIGNSISTGENLQVTGTMKVTGASTFNANMALTLNHNAATFVSLTNSTSGTASEVSIRFNSNSGVLSVGKYSTTTTAYKTLAANDAIIFNSTADISILNDNSTGAIKLTAGGSSTAHFTIASTGAATFSSSVTSTQFRLSALNTAPATASSTGTLGEIRIDADYIYICTATNTWKRVAIATW